MTDNVVPISEEILPPDLQEKLGAVKALATTYNLLDNGCFTQAKLEAIRSCMAFIHNIYEQAVNDALAHPESSKSAELNHLRSVVAVKERDAFEAADAEKIVDARKKRAKKEIKLVKKKAGKR